MIGYRKISLALGMAILFITSCKYDTLDFEYSDLPEEVSFSEHMLPYFGTSCARSGCHAAGAVPPDLSEENAYDALISGGYVSTDDPASSIIYTKIADGGTMYQFATDYDRELTLKWIEQGALDN